MKRNNIPSILMLSAGAVTCIITFVRRYGMLTRLTALFAVLLVFYVLGCVIKWMLDYFDAQNRPDEIPGGEDSGAEADTSGAGEGTQEEQDN